MLSATHLSVEERAELLRARTKPIPGNEAALAQPAPIIDALEEKLVAMANFDHKFGEASTSQATEVKHK